jgi:large subunit ribosomal protein L3
MKFILGKKIGMSQTFDSEGNTYPATLLKAGPLVVTQIKTAERDGYSAIQVGLEERKPAKLKKAKAGHLKEANSNNIRILKEFRFPENQPVEFKVGDKINASIFSEGALVSVSAVAKGKGFQGVVKRHGFAGGSRTHGQKHSEREPGSIGVGGVQRVLKGKKMPGRMGGKRITIKNLKVIQVLLDDDQMILNGAVPGRRGTLVEIREMVSNQKSKR